jgi:hypothetical protein
MEAPEHFAIVADGAVYRPTGEVSLEEAVGMITSAITFTRQARIGKLLVDVTGLTGFPSPTLAARYFFIQEWARASGGFVRIAMVARPEMIDPQKFGVTVAANSGLVSDVFDSMEDAVAWLQALE